MTVLSTILNGSSLKDVRDTMNAALGDLAALKASPSPSPTPAPSLGTLSLGASSVQENAASGTVIGGIIGKTGGSTVTIVDTRGNRFAISGADLVAGATSTDYETATSYQVTLRETLANATNSPRDTTFTIGVTNVFEQPNLQPLSFANAGSLRVGASASGAIVGATTGSIIAATGLPAGFSVDGAARTWAYDGSGSAATTDVSLRETLGDSANSPRTSIVPVSIAAASTGSSPVVLATTAIVETGINTTANNSSRYVDLGTMSLPDGDWTIHIAAQTSSGAPGDTSHPIFSLGTQSNDIVAANGNVQIGAFAPGSSVVVDPYRGMIVASGFSDNGGSLQRGERAETIRFGGAASSRGVPMLAGPRDSGAPGDNRPRSIFLIRRGTTIELWVADPGCVPWLHESRENNTFGAVAAKPAILGAINRVDRPYGCYAWHLRMARFFKVNRAMTPAQMAAVQQGVDPRALVTFDAATDRLVTFDGTTADLTDKVSGQAVKLVGSGWVASNATLIPSTVTADMPRARVYGYGQVIQRNGAATSDLPLDGTVTGQDGDIWARVVDWADTSAVVADWQKVATSSGGTWSGRMTGVPSNARRWLDVQLRKGTDGTVYSLRRQIGLGVLVDMQGQSIAEYMASSGNRSVDAAVAAFTSFHTRSRGEQRSRTLGWNRTDYWGWGATLLAQKIAEQVTAPIGIMCGAVSGSTAASWAGRTDPSVTATPAFADLAMYRPGYVWWQQGQGSTGDSDAVHTADLDKIEADRRASLSNGYRLVFTPLINGSATDLSFTRFIQERWLRSRMASDSRIVDTAALVDLALKDTVHQTDDARGAGRIAERVADKIAFLEGARPADPLGPRVVSARRISDTVTRVTLQQRGGTGLRTPGTGAITGFEVSTAQGFGSTLAISGTAIVDAVTVDLTHAGTGGALPWIWYQRGRPGQDGSTVDGLMSAVANALYDNASPSVNGSLGYPVYFMAAPIQAI